MDEFAPVVKSYSECLTAYRGRADVASYCRSRFPLSRTAVTALPPPRLSTATPTQPPATTPPATTAPPSTTTVPTAPPSTSTQDAPTTRTLPGEPVDITPQVTRLIEAWATRPRTPRPPPRPPADPLAVIPQIQAACAAQAGDAERWRRCTTDAWKQAGLRGLPPLALQVPPAPPPPVYEPPPTRPEPSVQSRPPPPRPNLPVQSRPSPTQPVQPTSVVEPEPPVAAVTPPSASPALPPAPPPVVVAPTLQPTPPVAAWSVPVWVWLAALAALVVAAAGGFGLAKLLGRARPSLSHAQKIEAAALAPAEVALVVDPGVVVLKPDGPPRAGMAVSMRFALDAGPDDVRLRYPSLETAP